MASNVMNHKVRSVTASETEGSEQCQCLHNFLQALLLTQPVAVVQHECVEFGEMSDVLHIMVVNTHSVSKVQVNKVGEMVSTVFEPAGLPGALASSGSGGSGTLAEGLH